MKVEKMTSQEIREHLLLEERQNEIKSILLDELSISETAEAFGKYVSCNMCPLFESCMLEDITYGVAKHSAHTDCAEQLVDYMLGRKEKRE